MRQCVTRADCIHATEGPGPLREASEACRTALHDEVPLAEAALEDWWRQPALEAVPWMQGARVVECAAVTVVHSGREDCERVVSAHCRTGYTCGSVTTR